MHNHSYYFDGGDKLSKMSASWFVSYYWYNQIDNTHFNWKKVSSYNNRISVYNRTKQYHTYWLRQIALMNADNLNKNTIGLSGYQVIEMAKELLS